MGEFDNDNNGNEYGQTYETVENPQVVDNTGYDAGQTGAYDAGQGYNATPNYGYDNAYAGAAPEKDSKVFAIISLVCGIVSLLCSCCGWLSIVLGVAAVVLGLNVHQIVQNDDTVGDDH